MITTGRSAIKGKGAFAGKRFKKGARVMRLSGSVSTSAQVDRLIAKKRIRNDDPFEIGGGNYLILDYVPLMANHSCNPNTGVRGRNELIALRAISAGEEITYDYSTVVGKSDVGERDWSMRCRCSATACRTTIGNWQTLPQRRLSYYLRNRAMPTFILKEVRASDAASSNAGRARGMVEE